MWWIGEWRWRIHIGRGRRERTLCYIDTRGNGSGGCGRICMSDGDVHYMSDVVCLATSGSVGERGAVGDGQISGGHYLRPWGLENLRSCVRA